MNIITATFMLPNAKRAFHKLLNLETFLYLGSPNIIFLWFSHTHRLHLLVYIIGSLPLLELSLDNSIPFQRLCEHWGAGFYSLKRLFHNFYMHFMWRESFLWRSQTDSHDTTSSSSAMEGTELSTMEVAKWSISEVRRLSIQIAQIYIIPLMLM